MTSDIQTKLDELGIKLDSPAIPAGNYVPVLVIHDMVYVSGQLPLIKGATPKSRPGNALLRYCVKYLP